MLGGPHLLCSKSWVKVGLVEHTVGRAGEKESKLRFSGFLKGGKDSPEIEKWSSDLIVSCLPSIHEVWVINLYVLDLSGFCSLAPFCG